MFEERTLGRAYSIRKVSREGPDDRTYSINLPKAWCDTRGIDKYVKIEETDDALIIRPI